MQSIWFCSEKGHPIQFALNGIRGAAGKHLRANDLIKASQASPLTHSIKAICWLLNKRIIFYLDFCVREWVPCRSWIQVGGCHCGVFASYPCRDFGSMLSGRFSFLCSICVWAARVAAVVKHGGLHRPLHAVWVVKMWGCAYLYKQRNENTSKELCT